MDKELENDIAEFEKGKGEPWAGGSFLIASPKITCCRCKAEEVEEFYGAQFSGAGSDYAKEHYGTDRFSLCAKCSVEAYAAMFGVSK